MLPITLESESAAWASHHQVRASLLKKPILANSVNKPPADVAHPSKWHHVHGVHSPG
jgi:hypothetical protein